MKRFVAMCLSLVLMLALATPAAAYDGAEWTVPEDWFDTDSQVDEDQWQERLDAAIEKAGGVPGQVNVMVNGKCVAFPYAAPEITDGGRAMVPMRAILEALGAEVTYDEATKTAQAVLGERTITHVIGTDAIAASDGGSLTMDTVSYIRDGSTLVPVRFFSQALGYEVYWDDVYRAVVLIDKETLVQELDSSFAVLNGLLGRKNGSAGNMRMDMSFAGTAELSGSGEIPFSFELSALYNEKTTNISGTADLASLPVLLDALGEEMPEELAALPESLDFQCIFSDGKMWIESPVLTALYREEYAATELPDEVWFKTADAEFLGDMGQMFDLYDAAMAADVTMGGILYSAAETADAETPFDIYADLTEAAFMAAELLGDGTFTKDGGAYAWSLKDALPEVLGALGIEPPVSASLTVREDGSCEFALELDYEDMVKASIAAMSAATEASAEGQIHVQDTCDVAFRISVSLQPSEDAPIAEPPAGAQVISLD